MLVDVRRKIPEPATSRALLEELTERLRVRADSATAPAAAMERGALAEKVKSVPCIEGEPLRVMARTMGNTQKDNLLGYCR